MAAATNTKGPIVRISHDNMEASLLFPLPIPGEERPSYSANFLEKLLNDSGVVFGIDKAKLMYLSENVIYGQEILVAQGYEPVPGQPGHFEFLFPLELNTKPIIREDGTTDYMSIVTVVTVDKDELVAIYHPAKQGVRGTSVRGAYIDPKPVRDLPPIAGRGFIRSEDNLEYRSAMDGKIEYVRNRIIISPILEIHGDAGLATGNIDFNGDVLIHGGAKDGVIIKATGNITIEGLVEYCFIKCGRNLYLIRGIKGEEISTLSVTGDLTAKFVERADVTCYGSIYVDSLFCSNVICDGQVFITGRYGSIIGGEVSAVHGVSASEIGNDFGTVTKIVVGVDNSRLIEMYKLDGSIVAFQDQIDQIKQALKDFETKAKSDGINYDNDPRRLQLVREKIKAEADLAEAQTELNRLEEVIKDAGRATVTVYGVAYSGSTIVIDDHTLVLEIDRHHVEFVKSRIGVRIEELD